MALITERVWCCVCGGTGKLSRFVFWTKACNVCDGIGKRPIIMDADFPEDIKQMLRDEARYGRNTYAALSGRRNNMAVNALSQIGII